MKDFKEVIEYIGQTYELFDLMPGKGVSSSDRKRMMEAYKKKAREMNIEIPKSIKKKANFVMFIIPLIAEYIIYYMLRIEFSIALFLVFYPLAFFGIHFMCSILWCIVEMFKKDGLKKGLVKLFWGVVIFSIWFGIMILFDKFDKVNRR